MRHTQKSIILDHLMKSGSITPAYAYENYGVYRLSAVIEVLRKENHNIETKMMKHYNANRGRTSQYAKYVYHNIEVGETFEMAFG
jgi:hypothetical protein|tara:strand:- start:42 stop:296 length:255 start_codon:yes stop_codon:yes gene_type:complete